MPKSYNPIPEGVEFMSLPVEGDAIAPCDEIDQYISCLEDSLSKVSKYSLLKMLGSPICGCKYGYIDYLVISKEDIYLH